MTWSTSGTKGISFAVTESTSQAYVEYDLRRNQVGGSKQIKFNDVNNGGSRYSNATFGRRAGYTSAEYGIYHGDLANASNDQVIAYNLRGYGVDNGFSEAAFSRTPHPTARVVTPSGVFQDITGSVWESWAAFCKFNDPGINNGEFAVWKNGELVFWASDMWNADESGVTIGRIGIGEYTQITGLVEDYRNLRISYDRPSDLG